MWFMYSMPDDRHADILDVVLNFWIFIGLCDMFDFSAMNCKIAFSLH